MAGIQIELGHAHIPLEVQHPGIITEAQLSLPPVAVGFEPVPDKPRVLPYEAFIPAIQALIVPTPEAVRVAILDYLRATHVKLDDRPVTNWTENNPWFHALQDVMIAAAMIKGNGGFPEALDTTQACFSGDLEFNLWGLPDGGAGMRPLLLNAHEAGTSDFWRNNKSLPGGLSTAFRAAADPYIGRGQVAA